MTQTEVLNMFWH